MNAAVSALKATSCAKISVPLPIADYTQMEDGVKYWSDLPASFYTVNEFPPCGVKSRPAIMAQSEADQLSSTRLTCDGRAFAGGPPQLKKKPRGIMPQRLWNSWRVEFFSGIGRWNPSTLPACRLDTSILGENGRGQINAIKIMAGC